MRFLGVFARLLEMRVTECEKRYRSVMKGTNAPRAVLARMLIRGATMFLALVTAVPAMAVCTSHANGADLMKYIGTNYGDLPKTLDADPAVYDRLRRLPPAVLAHLHRNLEVRGPVDLVSCHLVVNGNAAHEGGMENAIVDVDLYSGEVTAALLSQGRITLYVSRGANANAAYNTLPTSVRWWAAMAATGFEAADHAPPATEIVAVPGP